MATLIIPDRGTCSLGPAVASWMEQHLVFGPGDLRGRPLKLSPERRYLLDRMYEVDPITGRRVFDRATLSLPKGVGKTELIALCCIAEVADDSPVRFAGWNADGSPRGRPVKDPVIYLLATTERQTESLAFHVVRAIVEESDLGHEFVIAQSRVERKDGRGLIEPVASTPPALEGSLVSFQAMDELQHFDTPRLLDSHKRMIANAPKRGVASEPWTLGAGLGYVPGEGSVAEAELEHAEAVARGEIEDKRFFYYRRWAAGEYKLATQVGREAAVREARGDDAASWSDVGRIAAQWEAPGADPADLERVWLNRTTASSSMAFDMVAVRAQNRPHPPRPPRGSQITIGFDGSRRRDATAIVGCTLDTGHLFDIGLWEREAGSPESWEVPETQVDEVMRAAFRHWKVVKCFADPWYFQDAISRWHRVLGRDKVEVFNTASALRTATEVRFLATAFADGAATWNGDVDLFRHMANSRRRNVVQKDENGQHLYVLAKERADLRIDAAMAMVLAWAARRAMLAKTKTNIHTAGYPRGHIGGRPFY